MRSIGTDKVKRVAIGIIATFETAVLAVLPYAAIPGLQESRRLQCGN
jgi:hypothetical protein